MVPTGGFLCLAPLVSSISNRRPDPDSDPTTSDFLCLAPLVSSISSRRPDPDSDPPTSGFLRLGPLVSSISITAINMSASRQRRLTPASTEKPFDRPDSNKGIAKRLCCLPPQLLS